MKPEEKARKKIDKLLGAAGWIVQEYRELNLGVGLGVAVGDFPLKTGFAKGNYTMSAYAWPLPNETDTLDNTLVYGRITVTISGDLNGDFTVDIYDAIILANHYNQHYP
jgi:hypothetical protein